VYCRAFMVRLDKAWACLEKQCQKHPTRALLLFFCLQLIGLLLFTSGFLLSRVQLGKFNSEAWDSTQLDAPTTGLGSTPPFEKAIILVIDALRLDFVCAQPYSTRDASGAHVESMQGIRAAVSLLVRSRAALEYTVARTNLKAVLQHTHAR
jgi:hypothetical protein